ncbi:MAG: hypothetical protein Q9177_003992 [Variospora cf. flavescens]
MAGRPSYQWAIRSLRESAQPPIYRWRSPYRALHKSSCRPKPQQKSRGLSEDSYAYQYRRQLKAANVARQGELQEQRAAALGDPIRGVTTPFIESLGSALPPQATTTDEEMANATSTPFHEKPSPSPASAADEDHLNYYLTKPEFDENLDYSRILSEPLLSVDRETVDPVKEAEAAKAHELGHQNAYEAVSRIVSLANANNKERTRANVQRIIDTFGRHNTDLHLKPKAPSLQSMYSTVAEQTPTPRAGPDTGSSEVQIGILTAKIRVLADRYEGANRNDKVNKRNLRLLLHRRQKLLKYMHKKERGSERWTNMIEKLGLTEATWKGQIAVE